MFVSIVNVAVSLLDWVMFPCLKMKKNANDCYELDNFAASKTSNSSARGRNAQLADREGRKDIVEEILPVLFRNGIPSPFLKPDPSRRFVSPQNPHIPPAARALTF